LAGALHPKINCPSKRHKLPLPLETVPPIVSQCTHDSFHIIAAKNETTDTLMNMNEHEK
jgi:hypothetical protein